MTASIRRIPADERGVILFVTLVLLALLMVVGVGAWLSVQNEFRVSANVTAGASAFYLADSGVEWAKEQLGNTTSNPPLLANRSQTTRLGSFAVVFTAPVRNQPLSAQVVVRSTGTLGHSSQTVQAQLTKAYDLTDAALALRGDGRGVSFSGDGFWISGTDFDPASGAPVRGALSRLGVSLSSQSRATQVESGLSDVQKRNIVSGNPDTSAINGSDKIPSPMVAGLAADLCNSAAAHVMVMAASPMSFSNQTWGFRAAPEIHCVKGMVQTDDSVTIAGNFNGAGILIIQDAELVVVGSFRWEGLVLVTGDNVGFRVEGMENKEIFGGLIVNETGTPSGPGPALFDVQGAIRILFSRPALNNLAGLIPDGSLARSYAFLPFAIRQDYWRTETP